MVELFKKVDHIGLTTDMLANKNGSNFNCLTGHFFNKKFDYISITLAFRRFYKRHTSLNVQEYLEKELEKLGISKKVVSITTDNANDIKKQLLIFHKN